MVKVAIDDDGEVIAVYNETVRREDMPPGHEAELALSKEGEGPIISPPDMEAEATVIDLPEHDRESFAAETERRAGGKVGRVWLVPAGQAIQYVEAGREEPKTATEAALVELRNEVESHGTGKDEPLTAADIDRVIERERSRNERGLARGERRGRA